MRLVSDEYKKSAKDLLRRQGDIKIQFDNIAVGLDTDGTWEDTGHTDYSDISLIDTERKVDPIITLELNRWELNSNFKIYDGTSNDGYVSSEMSDSEGNLFNPQKITKETITKYNNCGLTFYFDANSYPANYDVVYYQDDVVIEEKYGIKGNKARKNECFVGAELFNKLEITFHKLLPYHRARVEYIIYGIRKLYNNRNIENAKITSDVDSLSRKIPSNKLTFTIIDNDLEYNPDNTNKFYDSADKSPINVKIGLTCKNGIVEWIPPQNFVLSDKPTIRNRSVSFNAYGKFQLLNTIFYKGMYRQNGISLYDLAVEVIEDTNYAYDKLGNPQFIFDEDLKDITTKGILPICTHAEALQMIAHAGQSKLYIDDDNKIRIDKMSFSKKGLYTGEFSDNNHIYYSKWDSIDNGADNNFDYATLELNQWELGKPHKIIDKNYADTGYISESLSDENGDISGIFYKRTFEVSKALHLINIYFDTINEDYPSELKVEYYDRDDNLITETTVNPTDYFTVINNSLADNVRYIKVIPIKLLPYTRFRVRKQNYRETDFVADFTTIRKDTMVITKTDRLSNVNITKYDYVVENTANNVYQTETTEDTLHIELNSQIDQTTATINISGGTITEQHIYSNAIDLVMSSGTKTITVNAKTIKKQSNIINLFVSEKGEEDTEDNILITSDEMANSLAEHIRDYLIMRTNYDFNYRGNPELETGDNIGIQTQYAKNVDALILTNEFNFKGSFSGKLKCKSLV